MFKNEFKQKGIDHEYECPGPNNARSALLAGGSGLFIDEKTRIDAFLKKINGESVWKEVVEKDADGEVVSRKEVLRHDAMLVEAAWNHAMGFFVMGLRNEPTPSPTASDSQESAKRDSPTTK